MDFDKWCKTGFTFTRDGKHFMKPEGSADFYVDDCEFQVSIDDDTGHEIPILIMWLIAADAIDPD